MRAALLSAATAAAMAGYLSLALAEPPQEEPPPSRNPGLVGTPTPRPGAHLLFALPALPDWTPTPTPTEAPTPTPEPTPTPRPTSPPSAPQEGSGRPTGGSLEALVCSYDWDCGTALRVMYCESHGQNVQNAQGGPFVGPFQVWLGHFRSGENAWDVATNVAVAYRVWQAQGWSPWSCY